MVLHGDVARRLPLSVNLALRPIWHVFEGHGVGEAIACEEATLSQRGVRRGGKHVSKSGDERCDDPL